MPIPKEWDSKTKVLGIPIRKNDSVMCHNCLKFVSKNVISICTGLCPQCVDENPTFVEMPKLVNPRPDNNTVWCKKCYQNIHITNFGISRSLCNECRVDNKPLKQRCIGCRTYSNDCWNNMCNGCRSQRVLCERIGWFFKSREHHRRVCWCLTMKESLVRKAKEDEDDATC